jgi:multimeric flavodoxin WrbA
MRILAIMGSPRIKGNTDLLLNEAVKGAESQGAEVEKLIADKVKVAPCKENYHCLRDGNCSIRDDMDDIYTKLLEVNGIIVASPIFFYGVTSQLKTIIDRCQALWARKYVLKLPMPDSDRRGAFIAVGATTGKKLFDGSILTVKYFFQAIGVRYVDELLIRGIDKMGEINEHPTAFSDAFELGSKLAKKQNSS